MSDDAHAFGDGPLSASVKAFGAELTSLRHADHGELLWQAEPAWPRHSPVLFPIVGRLKDDTLRVGEKTYRMGQHGFARDRAFQWTRRDADGCTLALEDDDGTRAMFPFAFRLTLDYAIRHHALQVTYAVTNTGDGVLPASVGAHPAFRWPLAPGVPQDAHRLVFAQDEPEPIRRLDGSLLGAEAHPTPVEDDTLSLDPALFDADAIILDQPRSRSLRYEAGALELEFGWEGFEQLGLWSRRPGEFLCIEPWRGYASPVDFDGAFADKPGLMHIPPGETRTLFWRVGVSG